MAAGLFKAPTVNYKSTSLNGAIDDSASTITVTSATNLQAPGYIVINREDGSGTATPNSREVVKYTGISSNDLTGCTRGADGSTARSHSDGALVETMFTVGMHNDQRDAINAEHDTDGTHTIIANATITQAYIANAELANATIATADIVNEVVSTATITTLESTDVVSSSASITLLSAPTITANAVVMGDSAPNINPKARAYPSAGQAISTATVTKISLNTVSYDVGGDFDTATDYDFTAPVDGYYLISGRMSIDSLADAKKLYAYIFKNGSELFRFTQHSSSSDDTMATGSDIHFLSSGDTIDMYVFHDHGSSRNTEPGTGGTRMSLAIHLLSV